MTRIARPFVILFALTAVAPAVGAQVLQPPARPMRGLFGGGEAPDPNRTHTDVTLSGNLLGGYDDNLSRPGGDDIFTPRPSGYIGVADANLRYWVGREARSLEIDGRGYTNTYSNVDDGALYGADQTLAAHTMIGRRTNMSFGEGLHYAPYFTLGLFGSVADGSGVANPDTNPTNSLNVTRTWTTDLTGSINHAWTRRLRTEGSYRFTRQTYAESAAFDSLTNVVEGSIDQLIGRWAGIRGTFRHSAADYTIQSRQVGTLTNDSVDGGFTYQRNLSRTRRVSFAAGLGALHVDVTERDSSVPIGYWTPSAYGTARVDLWRSWSVAGDYRRAASVLEGLNPQTFVTHSAIARTGGFLSSRIEAVVSASYANGQAGLGEALADGRFNGYTGTVQFRFLLVRGWSSVISYNHYRYQLSDSTSQLLGVSPLLHRNAIRVGLTWAIPLFGNYADAPPASH